MNQSLSWCRLWLDCNYLWLHWSFLGLQMHPDTLGLLLLNVNLIIIMFWPVTNIWYYWNQITDLVTSGSLTTFEWIPPFKTSTQVLMPIPSVCLIVLIACLFSHDEYKRKGESRCSFSKYFKRCLKTQTKGKNQYMYQSFLRYSSGFVKTWHIDWSFFYLRKLWLATSLTFLENLIMWVLLFHP